MELDQSFLGGQSKGKQGGSSDEVPVTIAVERTQRGRLGRVRLEVAEAPGTLDMVDFASEVVSPGASIHTDGARMFTRLANQGYVHRATSGDKADDLDAVMPGPHLVSSLLKRWAAGTLHYRLSRRYMPYYLVEFTFRFNRRNSRARGTLFYRLLQQAVDTDPHPLTELIRGCTPAEMQDSCPNRHRPGVMRNRRRRLQSCYESRISRHGRLADDDRQATV